MSPRDYARMRERQEGRYYGLGIQILVTDGDITVSTVFEGSPAYQKGLRTGDVIARIEGDDAKGWTSDQAVSRLRGPRGIERQHRRPPVRLRPVDRHAGPAGRNPHPQRAGVRDGGRHDRVHAAAGFLRDDRQRARRRAARSVAAGHEAVAARSAGQPRRPARPGHSRRQPVPPPRRPDCLHPRPGSQLGSGLPGDRKQRLHRTAAGGADQPEQRQRLGDRVGRAPGPRPRGHRRRDHVRQGARAVGVPRQRAGRPGPDDRAGTTRRAAA